MIGRIGLGVLAVMALVALGRPAVARRVETPPPPLAEIAAGRVIAERDCGSCHAVGRAGDSPFEGAPRWRDLHARFDVSDLAESLAEGISVGHEAMPVRTYEPAEVQALIAYLKSLEGAEDALPKR